MFKRGKIRVIVLLILSLWCAEQCSAGTRMLEPPSRASLWRYGYGTPVNGNDDKTDCGGYDVHHELNNHQCGICGDRFDSTPPRPHEAGGVYVPGPVPVRAYLKGGFINVVMETTSTLFGKFEFRVCSISSPQETPTQDCFDTNDVLPIVEAELGTEYRIGSRQGIHSLNIQLPADLTCGHCILQWRHVTGFKDNVASCISCPNDRPRCHTCQGCGHQVWYQGCTDIAIYESPASIPELATRAPDSKETTTKATTTTAKSNENLCPCPDPDPNDNLIINTSKPYTSNLSTSTSTTISAHYRSNVESMESTTHDDWNSNDVIQRNLTMAGIQLTIIPEYAKTTPITTFRETKTTPRSITSNKFTTIASLQATKKNLPQISISDQRETEVETVIPPNHLRSYQNKLDKIRTYVGDYYRTKYLNRVIDNKLCYKTNPKKYPRNFDKWCVRNCPKLGQYVCQYDTCVLVRCQQMKTYNQYNNKYRISNKLRKNTNYFNRNQNKNIYNKYFETFNRENVLKSKRYHDHASNMNQLKLRQQLDRIRRQQILQKEPSISRTIFKHGFNKNSLSDTDSATILQRQRDRSRVNTYQPNLAYFLPLLLNGEGFEL